MNKKILKNLTIYMYKIIHPFVYIYIIIHLYGIYGLYYGLFQF